jgi:hypothetical protein
MAIQPPGVIVSHGEVITDPDIIKLGNIRSKRLHETSTLFRCSPLPEK